MLDSSNFGRMTTSTMQFDARDKSFLMTSWTDYEVMAFFQNIFILR